MPYTAETEAHDHFGDHVLRFLPFDFQHFLFESLI